MTNGSLLLLSGVLVVEGKVMTTGRSRCMEVGKVVYFSVTTRDRRTPCILKNKARASDNTANKVLAWILPIFLACVIAFLARPIPLSFSSVLCVGQNDRGNAKTQKDKCRQYAGLGHSPFSQRQLHLALVVVV